MIIANVILYHYMLYYSWPLRAPSTGDPLLNRLVSTSSGLIRHRVGCDGPKPAFGMQIGGSLAEGH